MPFTWLKHLLVFVCLFCIMEITGISVLSLVSKHYISQADNQQAADDDDAAERGEAKEYRLKELWTNNIDLSMRALSFSVKKPIHPHRQIVAHFAWVPPVPTPPPNFIV